MTPIPRLGRASPICASERRVERVRVTLKRIRQPQSDPGALHPRFHPEAGAEARVKSVSSGQRLALILCQKIFHARQSTRDIFLTVGIGNTNVSLSKRAEIRPADRGNTGLLK